MTEEKPKYVAGFDRIQEALVSGLDSYCEKVGDCNCQFAFSGRVRGRGKWMIFNDGDAIEFDSFGKFAEYLRGEHGIVLEVTSADEEIGVLEAYLSEILGAFDDSNIQLYVGRDGWGVVDDGDFSDWLTPLRELSLLRCGNP
ncbi:MAG: hypothetical protein PHX30_03720 [Candidatus Pacebacteria bacterium]|nr:hypothetical protein [Candidatus Paceibacterota bacterium]